MKEKLKLRPEPHTKIRKAEYILLVLLLLASVITAVTGLLSLNKAPGELAFAGTLEMERDFDAEDYDEDSTVCDVIWRAGDQKMIVSYPYEVYEELEDETITAYEYGTDKGVQLFFDHPDPTAAEAKDAYRQVMAEELMPVFNLANALIILTLSLLIMTLYGGFFTTYEKCWFMTIMVLATIFSVLFPEESANGVNGIWIMLLYLLDTFLNILCELLISKQSRYNFLVSVLVEITEIVMSLVLMYRFATMTVTLFFWLPIDIISYINWTKHKDEQEDELTAVRRLKGWQELLVIAGIAVWTVVVGYLISGLNIQTDFLGGNETLERWMI